MPTKPPTFRMGEAPRLPAKEYDKLRVQAMPWRKWYRTARWIKARIGFLTKNPRCVDCGKLFDVTQLEVDHEIPHRGDAKLFWDKANWRPRCKRCHSRKTGRGM